jgi:spermidine/putrescine transport system substrate-binding protein
MIRRVMKLLPVLVLLAAVSTWAAQPEGPNASNGQQELVFLTWSDYIDPEVVAAFEQKFDVKVRGVYFETDDSRDDMMAETDGRGYDVVLMNGIQIRAYVRRGWLAPLNQDDIPNLRHIDPRWLDAYTQTADYGVPYFWGTVGLAFRKDLVPRPITSWMELFRPAQPLRGRIAMIKSSRDAIGLALKALGYSANSTAPEAHMEAEQLLLEQRSHVKSYTYISLSEKSELVTGAISAAMVYNGDALALQEHEPDIAFVAPEEGTTLWVDYLTVTQSSTKKKLAMDFINFLNEPENAARLARFVHYATPNKAAEKHLPMEYFADPVIYPSKAVLAKSEFEAKLPPRVMKKRNAIFARVLQ